MNFKMIFNTTGKALVAEGALIAVPLIVALCLGESAVFALALTVGICVVVGTVLALIGKKGGQTFFSKDGFVAVALVWIIVAVVGALPFCIGKNAPMGFVDAFFESVSGFTTTGASVLDSPIDVLDDSLLLWRSLTHWIGGMGVIVFVMALTASGDHSMHVLRAEMPGVSVDKITPRASDTAKRLYAIYIGMTLVEVVSLLIGKVNVLESFIYSFGTAGTGGFGILADSLASYSPYVQWVITIFMFLFGVNFNLYYLILLGKVKSALKSKELLAYFVIVIVSIAAITTNLSVQMAQVAEVTTVGQAIRHSSFQVVSFMTTTGYGTATVTEWPIFSKAILFVLMFIGGCAGSTAGGLKVSRVQLLCKKIHAEIKHALHPRTTQTIKFDGKMVDDQTLNGVTSYFGLYVLVIVTTFLLLCLDGGMVSSASASASTFETNVTAAVSCVNNIGPCFMNAASYADFSVLSKVVLSFAMLFGRLEIYPMIILFSPATWKRN